MIDFKMISRKKFCCYGLIGVVAVLFALSCSPENNVIPAGDTVINKISADTLYFGDTLVVDGDFFGSPTNKSYIKLDSSHKFDYTKCLIWQVSRIAFRIPAKDTSYNCVIFVEGEAKDSFKLVVKPLRMPELSEASAGTFSMGSISGSSDETPVHPVNISKTFLITKYEITNKQYFIALGLDTLNEDLSNYPAVGISWRSAVDFCNSMSRLFSLDTCYDIQGDVVVWNKNANGFRLPTEAEWEYTARAGQTSDYGGTGHIDDMGWFNENSGLSLKPIGKKNPNDFMIYDMNGNAPEWCWDFYATDYYSKSPDTDPMGAASGTRHVLRGGSFGDGKFYARNSTRGITQFMTKNAGIRLVRNK